MWADRLALGLRPRLMLESVDLGARMVQQHAATLARAYLPAAALLAMVAASTWWWDPLAPMLVFFLFKPWLDRAALLVFARTAFGQPVAARDVWHADGLLTWRGIARAVTLVRLSPWRAYTQPVDQLEGLRGAAARQRRRLLLRGKRGVAYLQQAMFWLIEMLLATAITSLLYWLTPFDASTSNRWWSFLLDNELLAHLFAASQLIAAVFLEPFFVAAGFSMYLNRRVELEAWDVEQELRRAFAL
ncbi:hypothetical protein AACH06_11260 [Ideonella sp. DXS29W]|uniref:DUF4129 domain-containing protein n=1 Tax=Ideonella lacteola TaxID=2984193 RepID=A0ABU9BRA1_9BURK